MKKHFFFVCLVVSIVACSNAGHQPAIDSIHDTIVDLHPSREQAPSSDLTTSVCDIVYDTITNPNYLAHVNIMKRYFTPGKRAWSTVGKDTMETWCYPQDIGVFFQELDSTEQGMYRNMTNKIIFLLLNHDSRCIIFPPYNQLQMHYFLWHLRHPMCASDPIDSTIARVHRNMPEKTPEMKKFKEAILSHLAQDK